MALDDIFKLRRDYFRLRLLLHVCRWRKGLFNCGFPLLILTGAFLVLWMLHLDDNVDTSSPINTPIMPIRNRSSLMTMSPGKSVVHSHHFHYIINEPHLCLVKRFILIFVTSSPENEERRMAIRKTWGSPSHLKLWRAAVIFLLGAVVDQRLQKQIREESMSYRDILQEDFVDSYRNLTLKSVMALKWSSNYCPGVRYVLKTDDDIYVNVPLLMSFLKLKVNKKRWIVGCIKQHVGLPIKIEGGRPVASAISFPGHPPFVAGAGYVISGDLVEDLYLASLKLRFIPVEDVFVTGHCSQAVGVRPQHDGRFSCGEFVSDDCVMKDMFTGHKISPKEQFQIWNTIHFGNARRCVS